MSPQMWVAILLASGAVLAGLRFAWIARRRPSPRGHWWLLLAWQPAVAALLYLSMYPPTQLRRADRLVVLTAGATAAQAAPYRDAATILALPEAPAAPGVTRVPDLGTALRQNPDAARVLVLGAGLEARDRDAVAALALEFRPVPLPRAVVELSAPAQATIGARWRVAGRVHAVSGGVVELIDPAGRRVDLSRLGSTGNFAVAARLAAPGRAPFVLRLRDAGGALLETEALPVQVDPGARLRVLVLAGGPGPELKYLRRWALDAGADLHTQIDVGGGLRLGDAPIAWSAASLAAFDLAVLDERAWRGLGTARRSVLRDAVASGLGLLLRVTGPLATAERRELRTLGFELDAANVAQSVALPAGSIDQADSLQTAAGAPELRSTAANGQEAPLLLTRQPLRVGSADAVPLLRAADDSPLALWRNAGQGRVAVWWLTDSYRLVLSGQAGAHGRLWSQAFATVARARHEPGPWLASADPRPLQRLVLCGLRAGEAFVRAPDGRRIPLLAVRDGEAGCAAYWPDRAGWHELHHAGARLAVLVRDDERLPGLRAFALREATQQLVAAQADSGGAAQAPVPGPRWPWFLAWCLLAATGWWLERRWLRRAAAGVPVI